MARALRTHGRWHAPCIDIAGHRPEVKELMFTPDEDTRETPVATDPGQTWDEGAQSWLLLVDDDPISGRSSGRCVQRASGLLVRLAESRVDALALVAEHGEPTAVLCDFELNGETGVEVVENLRAMGCSAPCALLTGAPERALETLARSRLDEVVPVFGKRDARSGLWAWLDQTRLCLAHSA